MIVKKIDFDGYNTAIIKQRFENGNCICDLQFREGDGSIGKNDTDILFFGDGFCPFELTKEEIKELTPPCEGIIEV